MDLAGALYIWFAVYIITDRQPSCSCQLQQMQHS